jgi:hypothetical protein
MFATPSPPERPTAALVFGGLVGAASAGMIVWVGTRRCFDVDCLLPFGFAILWEGAAVPLGVHVANKGQGPLGLLPSYFIEGIGLLFVTGASERRSDAGMAAAGILTIGTQIALVIDGKRRAARKASRQ